MSTRFLSAWVYGTVVLLALAWTLPAALLMPLPSPGEDYNTAAFLVRHSWVKFARVATSPLRPNLSEPEKDAMVRRFFELNEAISEQERIAGDPESAAAAAEAASASLTALRSERSSIENDVEDILDGRLTELLEDLGLTRYYGADIVWPPVNVEFEVPPAVLVTSPRTEIKREGDRLLDGSLTIEDRVRIEQERESGGEKSALVVNIGAIAMYPAIVPPRADYRGTLQTIAHEWVHHYLYFAPLGRDFYKGGDLVTLNETVANMAGNELGAMMYERLALEESPVLVTAAPFGRGTSAASQQQGNFEFGVEMRNLRLEVDALLTKGLVEEAERVMEERRLEFVFNGYYIRRINQAYFAFHGTYADTPASSDPIGPKMIALRERAGSVEAFVEAAREITSESDLDALVSD